MKLFVVDDEKMIKEYIKFIIAEEAMKIEVFEASTGKEAIDMAPKIKPFAVLMDIKMPEGNGLEAARKIVEKLPYVKIVFLSAYDKFEYAQEALRLGAMDYLLKPISPEDLKQLLKRLLTLTEKQEAKPAIMRQEEDDEDYEDEVIVKAKEYIQAHYHEKVQLQDVANYAGLSSTYFSKFFKQKTGINFSNYLNQVRLHKAKELMKNPNLTLNEISYRVGYEDLSYFSIVFQRYEGMTPTNYRRQLMTK
ncbi:response regulator transcription factor [Clostridium formicaceticum]|uniref:Stage 0 sporulation protein A homolog n=1 Tax=Clostridium formicaceticum TaxID=1497 RepID=A0AAC9RI70_9CLOT|nr:response regulator [Clostridium formicaceticum]AOY75687.1 hypothetical protein BJL90_07130 [Clostridium formicaceticum]ARE86004.1 putative response regulatory protein [Clostridium formicaceticum]